MEMVTDQTPADLNVKPKLKRKRKGRKREASDGCAVQGMIQKDRSMHDIESGKNGMMAASSYSQEKPMELDFTAKWSQESPKSSSVTTTDPLKKPSKSEKKRVKRKANDGCAVESMDLKDTNMHVTENGKNGIIAEPCSPVKPVELDSTAKLSQENPKSSDDTTTNPLKKLSNSKRKSRGGKRKANEGMERKDKSMHDIENGKNGMIVEPCSPDKPMELDSTTKLSQENPKYAVDTTTNPLEKPSKSQRKWLRRVKREANGGCAVQVMDQKDKNMYDIENGKAEPCSPGKAVEHDSTAKLSQENPKSDDDTTNNPLEKLSKSKKKHRGGKREADEGMNQKDKSMRDIENDKNGMIVEPCSPEKPMELGSTAKLSEENPKSAVETTSNPLEKPSKSERKQSRRVKKEANGGCAVQVMDQKDKNMYDIENGKAEPCSPGKAVELDSTAKLSQENPKSDDDTTNNPLEKLSKSKKKHRGVKREADEGMNQKDKSMRDIENDKNGMIVEPCSPEKPMELGSTAKLSEENPKSAVETTSNPLEKPSKSERKQSRRVKKEANGGCAVQVMDQKDKNMYDIENGKAEPCSPGKAVELDSTAELSQENPKSDDDTTNNPLEKLSKSKKKHRGGKREADEGMNQKDKSMRDIENDKNGMIVEPCSPEKPMELGSTAKLSEENPKSAVETTSNPLEKPSKSERKRSRRVKKEANGGCAVQVMDQKDKNMYDIENGKAEPCSPGKAVELDSTAKLSQENPKSDDDTTNNPLEKLSKSKKKHRGGKREADEGMNQKDKSMRDIENDKNGMIVEPCSPEKPMELGSTAKLSEENPKSAVETTSNPLEKPSKSERKRSRRVKKEANGGCAVQVMDQKDKNMYDIENGKAEPCSPGKAVELDSTAKLPQENPKSDDDTTNNPLEKLSKSKKKHRGGKREADEGMNQKDKSMRDIENDKNGMIVEPCSPEKPMELGSTAKLSEENPKSAVETTSNPLEKPSKSERKRSRRVKKEANGGCAVQGMDQKDKNMYDAEKGKNGMIAEPCSSGKPMELDSTAKLSQENPKYGEDTLPNPLEKLSKSKRKRLMKASKKAAANLGPESMDLTNIVSNLSLADASDAFAGDNVNYGTDLSQESRRSTGNGICNRVDMRHKSSIVTSETHNNLLADPYRIIQRRKLLILDVNGLLADVVFQAPQGCQPDTRTLGRAIFKRPFYLDFLNFCFEKFDVGIWSSRTKRVLDKVVDYLLGDLKPKLRFCWDASHCTETKFKTLENRHKPMVFKELRKLWEKHDPSLPWKKGDYDESNTLLVDDSPYKALLNPIHTGVFPCSYTYHNKSDNLLGPGGEIRVYLEGLAAAGNVQHYVAQNPFGQSAINGTNPSWNFYSEVLQSLLRTSG